MPENTQNISRLDNASGLAGILSAVLTQATIDQETDNTINANANNLMAAALVIIALLATQLQNGPGHWNILTIISGVVQIAVVLGVIYLTRSRPYLNVVVDLASHRDYFAKDDALLLAQLIEDANFANDQNAAILRDKQVWFRNIITIFVLGFALGAISVFFAT